MMLRCVFWRTLILYLAVGFILVECGKPPPKAKGALPNRNPKSKIRGRNDAYDEDETGSQVSPKPDVEENFGKPKPDVEENFGKPKPDEDEKEKEGGGENTGANGCICVPYYQCDNGKVLTDGTGLIDPRKITPPKAEIPLDANYQPPYCGTFHVCCTDPEASTQQPYIHRCGVRNPSGINRRILSPSGKGESDFGEWPWQVAVLKNEKEVNLFQCGGVLIDQFHVLTVAHCVAAFTGEKSHLLNVRLGEWDTQQTNEFLPHEDYKVVNVIIHPGYKSSSLWNDIAVLKLDKKVTFGPNIDTICLPFFDEKFDGQQCVTTGWGKSAYKGGSYSNILKEVSVPVISYEECVKGLRKTRLGPKFRLHESFMCAGGEKGRDSCKGDGGGPLTCYRKDGTYALAGLVSWGIDCGQSSVPGVYVKVQTFLDWISKVTGIDLNKYRPHKI